MSVIKLVGRTTYFKGKTLWEIVSNLKNFGLGRIVVRSRFEDQYPEKSYMRILKVEGWELPDNPHQYRRVAVTVERVFRGVKQEKPVRIAAASYKPDYRLLHKKEEADYCEVVTREVKILPQYMELPPLLKEFVRKETGQDDVKMRVRANESKQTNSRVAKDGEKPTIDVPMGLGTPHPKVKTLYEGISV